MSTPNNSTIAPAPSRRTFITRSADPAADLAVKFDALHKTLEEWDALPHDTEGDDERGEALLGPMDAIFDQMRETPATSIPGVLGKLRVAVHFLGRDFDDAPGLVEGAMNDLGALIGTKPGCDPVADIGQRIVNAVKALGIIDELSFKANEGDEQFLEGVELSLHHAVTAEVQYALSRPATSLAGAMVQCFAAMELAIGVDPGNGARRGETPESLSSGLRFALFSILGVMETTSGIDRDTIGGSYFAAREQDPAAAMGAALSGEFANLTRAA
jgi:hypothetical protein